MTPLKEAAEIFLKDPLGKSQKVLPYAKALLLNQLRHFAELFGIERYSRPYPNHDKLLHHIAIRNGFFVACGGNDGYGFDPTYYLERFRGWQGLIIEPIPKCAQACRKNRPRSVVIEAALVDNKHTGDTITLYDCNFMSVTANTNYDIPSWVKDGEASQNIKKKEYRVKARTLNSILDEFKVERIDLLVLDVEGAEEAVLQGVNLESFKPNYILIEIHDPALRTKFEASFLVKYILLEDLGQNDLLYERKDIVCRDR